MQNTLGGAILEAALWTNQPSSDPWKKLILDAAVMAIPKFQVGFRIELGTPKQLYRVVNFTLRR